MKTHAPVSRTLRQLDTLEPRGLGRRGGPASALDDGVPEHGAAKLGARQVDVLEPALDDAQVVGGPLREIEAAEDSSGELEPAKVGGRLVERLERLRQVRRCRRRGRRRSRATHGRSVATF